LEEEGAFSEKPTILNKDEEDESELVTYMKGEYLNAKLAP